MFNEKFNHDNPKSLNLRFRKRRFLFFKSLINTLPRPIKILDIGGTEMYWRRMNFADEKDISITLCNLDNQPVSKKNFSFMQADATDLYMIKDKTFDVVFSNSVIEHLYTPENQQKMANEIRRVGKNYFVQTPNLYFPIEPHWRFPLFQFLPFNTRVYLTQHFNLGRFPKTENKQLAEERVSEIILLSENQMKQLFPDGKCYEEKYLHLVKSITMYKFGE